MTEEATDVTTTYTDKDGNERCGHDMRPSWCGDCAELLAAGYSCGVTS